MLLTLPACPETRPPGDERLIAKLKAEQEREAKEGRTPAPAALEPLPKDDQVIPLAEFAAKGTQRRELVLPTKTLIAVGKASLRLKGLDAMHTVGEGISVTTDDWFLQLSFVATGPDGTPIDMTVAHLEREGQTYPFARDAQAASKQSARVAASPSGTNVIAFFEATQDAMAKGLTLVVPFANDAGETRLELQ